jgi:redox-sensitive bicupin YhaK (pirin superfamily)
MLDLVIAARRKHLGGFEVGRVLPFMSRRMVHTFIFFDHMGPPWTCLQRASDNRRAPHPHIGLSTFTYLFDAEITYRDSTGAQQAIQPGAVNWMTSGSGIGYSERFDGLIRESGGRVHGNQAWGPSQKLRRRWSRALSIMRLTNYIVFGEPGVSARLIAGQAFGLTNPVRTQSPLFYIHTELLPGGRIGIPSK